MIEREPLVAHERGSVRRLDPLAVQVAFERGVAGWGAVLVGRTGLKTCPYARLRRGCANCAGVNRDGVAQAIELPLLDRRVDGTGDRGSVSDRSSIPLSCLAPHHAASLSL